MEYGKRMNNGKNSAFLEEMVKNIKEEEVKREQIFKDHTYIDWLIEFTKKYPEFVDDSRLYEPDEISLSDSENVSSLNLFFEGIDKYAKRNYLYPTKDYGALCYSVKKDDVGFNIGVMAGQGVLFFCERVNAKDDFIDFDDIVNKTTIRMVESIDEMLEDLSLKIRTLVENGVPFEAIEEVIEQIKNDLRGEKPKKLIKK